MLQGKRIYISGKIGEEIISPATSAKFDRAEAMLRKLGADPFNPTSKEWQQELAKGYERDSIVHPHDKISRYAYCLLRDLMVIATCDAVYMLDDWDRSCGAGTEHSFCLAAGIPLYWQSETDAKVFGDDPEDYRAVWLPIEDPVP